MTQRGWADLYAGNSTGEPHAAVAAALHAGALRRAVRNAAPGTNCRRAGPCRRSSGLRVHPLSPPTSNCWRKAISKAAQAPARSSRPILPASSHAARHSRATKRGRSRRGAGIYRVRAVDGADRRAAVQHRPHAGRCAYGGDLAQLTHRAGAPFGPHDLGYTDPCGLIELRDEHLRLPADGTRGALRPGADRRHRRHPTGDRYRHPRAARARRRGVGRGSWLSADPRAGLTTTLWP